MIHFLLILKFCKRIEGIEAKYYADEEDAYAMRKLLNEPRIDHTKAKTKPKDIADKKPIQKKSENPTQNTDTSTSQKDTEKPTGTETKKKKKRKPKKK